MAFDTLHYSSQSAGHSFFDLTKGITAPEVDIHYTDFGDLLGDVNHGTHGQMLQDNASAANFLLDPGSDLPESHHYHAIPRTTLLPQQTLGFSLPSHSPVPRVSPPSDVVATTFNRLTTYVRSEDPWIPGVSRDRDPYYSPGEISHRSGHPSETPSIAYSFQDSAFFSGPSQDFSLPSEYNNENFLETASYHSPFVPDIDMIMIPETSSGEPGKDEETSTRSKAASSQTSKTPRGGKMKCPNCSKELKCPSDFKKHMLTHDKPHKCDVPGCNRTEGFGTTNDLDRHKASVHKILSSVQRKWQCAAPNCKQPDKLWPRLDNFKQHLERMHKGIDVNDIIEKSELRAQNRDRLNSMLDVELGGMSIGAGLPLPPSAFRQSRRAANGTNTQSTSGDQRLQALSSVAEVHQRLRGASTYNGDQALALIVQIARGARSAKATSSERSLKLLQEIDTIVSNQATEAVEDLSPSNHDNSSTGAPIKCPKCSKVFNRKCDMKKHQKRHDKPYVCTAAGCNHRSGSKYDWQRHEDKCLVRGKEHILPVNPNDATRVCLQVDPDSRTGRCGFTHTSTAIFERHLKDNHKILSEKLIIDYLDKYDVHYKPGTGWCGFCLDEVQFSKVERPTKFTGAKGTFECGYGNFHDRADHIDMHVSQEGRDMDSYISLEYYLQNANIANTNPSRLQAWYQGKTPGKHDARDHNPEWKKKQKKRKNNAEGCASDEDERRKKINEAKWTCCQCSNYQLIKMYPSCLNCFHNRCSICEETNVHVWADSHPLQNPERSPPLLPMRHGWPDHNRKRRRAMLKGPWDSQPKYEEVGID